ncbi:hypothetical protein SAMN05216474_0084 [Lishizhenia tianjinensis]|uniref:DUF4352 domain-containing protein n=1 Tax=Lishizhenia tianjinensis TaxID=477690 RepID=A0A1I6XCF4_9FLAO|nr:hypothetical protein [Lishizhenia tianjinensis]SFT35801.1 hypothetical protein SAMN05216474_0084 [Lishizhenia tianjinensis]
MKKLLLGLTFLSAMLISQVSFAQNQINDSELTTEFVQIEEQDGVKFSVAKQECMVFEGQKPLVYIFVKIENTTNVEKTVDFGIALSYVEGCSGCDYDSEFKTTLTIGAGETITGDCNFETRGTSRIVANPNLEGGWTFEGVQIMFIEIK